LASARDAGASPFSWEVSFTMQTERQLNSNPSPDDKTPPLSTRDHLIETGLGLMRKHGYGATGLQEILKAAAVPKGSFYHHFSSKEEFAVAVLNRYIALAEKHCQDALGHHRQPPLRRLRRYFEDLIRLAGQSAPTPGCLMGSLSLEIAADSSLLQASLSANFARWQTLITSVLREAMEQGELPASTRPEALAGFVLNSWEGALLRSQAERSDAPLRDFIHFIFETMLVP
jgi:TetR/AcrR family transcriptional regulator, transcriptional repressor for nem operon